MATAKGMLIKSGVALIENHYYSRNLGSSLWNTGTKLVKDWRLNGRVDHLSLFTIFWNCRALGALFWNLKSFISSSEKMSVFAVFALVFYGEIIFAFKTSVHVIKLTIASISNDHQHGCVQEYHGVTIKFKVSWKCKIPWFHEKKTLRVCAKNVHKWYRWCLVSQIGS